MMKQSKRLGLFLAVVTALFIFTTAIALPILLRPFYAAHIAPLGLEGKTGLSRQDSAFGSAGEVFPKQSFRRLQDPAFGPAGEVFP